MFVGTDTFYASVGVCSSHCHEGVQHFYHRLTDWNLPPMASHTNLKRLWTLVFLIALMKQECTGRGMFHSCQGSPHGRSGRPVIITLKLGGTDLHKVSTGKELDDSEWPSRKVASGPGNRISDLFGVANRHSSWSLLADLLVYLIYHFVN